MKRNLLRVVLLSVPLAAVLGIVFAADNSTNSTSNSSSAPSSRPADEKAIREAAQALASAFEKGDAAAFANLWTAEGEYVDEGSEPVHGRDAIIKAYAEFFAKRTGAKATAKSDTVRFLGQDTAIEEGEFTVQAPGAPADSNRYSTLYVRQNGKWLVAMMKEWSDEPKGANIQDLAWLIGTWEAESPNGKVQSSYEWAIDEHYIICKYAASFNKSEKSKPRAGMQIIGIDPNTKQVRAWTFDADGGYGESFWTFDGDRWAIRSAGTIGDGSETSSLNFLTPSGKDAFTWRSVQRVHGDENMPDIGPIKVTRVKAGT
jgi:uncharacterized protein (TIGR02246 family)